jgi:hypothetical protein
MPAALEPALRVRARVFGFEKPAYSISRSRSIPSATVDIEVDRGVVVLTGRVERWSTEVLLGRLVALIPGVVEVTDRITYDYDDQEAAEPDRAISSD